MSAQAGIWNFDGRAADKEFLAKLSDAITQYGPDGENTYFDGPVAMLYRPFHTTVESRLEHQPYVSPRGLALTWDGRLDNREDLIPQLHNDLTADPTDVAIVLAAYERWGADCSRKLIGDWALSIWDPAERTLILARDYAGIRHLYYYLTQKRVVWCTHLAPIVLLSGVSFTLNDEYIAGYLAMYPEAHLTPYREIQAVPPGSFVAIRSGKATARRYWAFEPKQRIGYKSDAGYEEHFRSVFAQSVRRRLRSDSPILAELSGGMDSSSIVCMADMLIAKGEAETPRLDTVSHYDDFEPNWNERPYFTKVEEKRGTKGCHLDVSKHELFSQPIDSSHFSPLPGATQSGLEFEQKRIACMESNGNRVLLSGIGGDESLGGVPTPIPELADLVVQGRPMRLAHQLKAWSLVKKQPWMHLLLETLGDFLPSWTARPFQERKIAPWLYPHFVRRHRAMFGNREPRSRVLGPLPSYQANVNTLAVLQRQLECSIPSIAGCYDVSYPYLDRDLLEFLYSVPRDQILRPDQRRSLMRRALVGIVPDEILNRKRKAYVSRRPLAHIESAWRKLQELCGLMISSSLGFVDAARFSEALQKAKHGQVNDLIQLIKTLKLELWLQGLWGRGVLRDTSPTTEMCSRSFLPKNRTEVIRP